MFLYWQFFLHRKGKQVKTKEADTWGEKKFFKLCAYNVLHVVLYVLKYRSLFLKAVAENENSFSLIWYYETYVYEGQC